MWRVARRPRWIAALVLALGLASGFAWLGQWQLARSVDTAVTPESATETPVPLAEVTGPGMPVSTTIAGQRVTVSGVFVPGDFEILSGRSTVGAVGGQASAGNPDDAVVWVVGHARTTDPGSPNLAVAIGWAPDEEAAREAIRELDAEAGQAADGAAPSEGDGVTPPNTAAIDLSGRYLPSDAPQQSDFEEGEQSALAAAALVNQWAGAEVGTEVGSEVGAEAGASLDKVYVGYVLADEPRAGLERIDSPAPASEVVLNLLNIFYGVEWAVFALFALYLWYRLVKDAWEREEFDRREAELH